MNMKKISILALVSFLIYGCDSNEPTTNELIKEVNKEVISESPESGISSKAAGEVFSSAAEEASKFVKKGESVVLDGINDIAENANTEKLGELASELGGNLSNSIDMEKAKSITDVDTTVLPDMSDAKKSLTENDTVASAVDKMTTSQLTGNSVLPEQVPATTSKTDMLSAVAPSTNTPEATAMAVLPSTTAEEVAIGKNIYTSNCAVCHTTGSAGAPRLTDSSWTDRKLQGMNILVEHAVKGFQGKVGYMPAKGGSLSLKDEEVSAAVLYMVSETK